MSGACPELGFDILLRLDDGVDAAAAGALVDELRAGLVEERGLTIAGDRGRAWWYTLTRDGGQATEADREAVAAWAAARPGIARCEVGPLVDLGGSR